MKTWELGLSCIPGLEELAANEARHLGFETGALFSGFFQVIGRHQHSALRQLLYYSRYILRVLAKVYADTPRNLDALKKGLAALDWQAWLSPNTSFRVDVNGRSEFASTQFLALVVKDAIVDSFRRRGAQRPSVDTRKPDIVFVLNCRGQEVTLSSDAAGASLNFRGYRSEAVDAPLNECIAASLSSLIGFREGVFIDPMCGSGTIAIEAALSIHSLFPAQARQQGFAIDAWPGIPSEARAPAKLQGDGRNQSKTRILGFDRDPKAVQISRRNASRAGLSEDQLSFEQESFEYLHANTRVREALEWARASDLPVYLVFNPPFDKRLGLEDAAAFYASIGDSLKQHWAPARAGIFTANLAAAKRIGLRSEKRHSIRNGPLDCRFIELPIH